MEMPCYCENHARHQDCKNEIPYVHHREWGTEEDYVCKECLDLCIG